MPVVSFIAACVLLVQAGAPSLLDRITTLDDAAAARLVASDPAAARRSLEDLLVRLDASVHSDRQQPEQRRVQYDRTALALGARVGALLADATGDRTYARRFAAREQRLAGTELLNDRRYRDALVPLEGALREAQALDDRWLETITRINLAYGHLELGQGKQALAECERASALSAGLDDRARGLTLFNLASVHLHLGNFARSIDYSRQAADVSRKAGIRLWEGNSLLNLGAAHQRLGQDRAARAAFQQALAVLEQTRDRLGIGRTLYNLGVLAAGEQRYAEAAVYLERALPIIRSLDIRHSHAIETDKAQYQNPFELSALRLLVDAYQKSGDEKRAAARLAELEQLEKRPPRQRGHSHPPK